MRNTQSSLKDEIVRVAVELGTELGEDGLTMRGIASRLGVSATALYQHFEGKASILRAIRLHGLSMINTTLEPCFSGPDGLACIADASRTYIRFARDNQWLYGVLFAGEGMNQSPLNQDEHTLIRHSNDKLIGCFQQAKDAGQLRDDVDVSSAPLLVWAANHGLAALMINGRIGVGSQGAMTPDEEAAFVDNFVKTNVSGFQRA